MTSHPVSTEIGAALASFVEGGAGPTHSALSGVFQRSGFGTASPYDRSNTQLQPSKATRIRDTVAAATSETHRARELVDGLLAEYRVARMFDPETDPDMERIRRSKLVATQRAFARVGWELSDMGELRPHAAGAVVSTVGRPAIEDQLERLRRGADDPALLLGTAKEMLESTAKYVMEAFSVPYRDAASFDEIWHHARERLGLLPQQVDPGQAGAAQVREILQSSWAIARMANEVRNLEGTGHGRTLPTAMSPEMAMLVVREACSVAELVLSRLDRATGR